MSQEQPIVSVTVTGLTGSGKSAIYGEIVLALQAVGVAVDHANPSAWHSECHMTHADWQAALDLYRPRVEMCEVNVPRLPQDTPSPSRWKRFVAWLGFGRTTQ